MQDILDGDEPEVTPAYELALALAIAARDDRVVVIAQHADEIARVHARRRTERGDRRRRVRFVGEEREVESLHAATSRAREIMVTAEDRLETLLGHEAERLL